MTGKLRQRSLNLSMLSFALPSTRQPALITTMLARYWDVESDGLAQSWAGERVWCNPPYGREQRRWIEKAHRREAEVAVLLLPARTDTVAWQDWILPCAEVCFLRGRIRFVGAPSSVPIARL